MFKYDFVILYELRKRELENAVLLAMMLEKKGYKVAIEYKRSARLLLQRANVILTPFLYHNEIIMDFALQPFCRYKKIINMQYEQVFQNINLKELRCLPTECAKNAVHISWGSNTTERYKKVGINPKNIFEIGHIALDLNSPKYRDIFLNRSEISKKFGIPLEKKWLLFISSFSFVGITKTEFEKWKKINAGTEYFSEISNKSQPIILDYFDQLAQKHPELEIIYRPHPHEMYCEKITKLKKKYENFKVIPDFSIRQWILVSDYISTWCSTSLADVFYAQKPCAIIRPLPFLEEYDYPIYRNQQIISDYQDLENFVNNPKDYYKLKQSSISDYYCNEFNANAFEKLRDVCIDVKNNKHFEYDYYKRIPASRFFLLKSAIYKILMFLAEFVDYGRFAPEKYREDVRCSHREMNKYKKEIKFYRKRFLRFMNNESA